MPRGTQAPGLLPPPSCPMQVDAQLQVVQKLEEKERVLQGALGTVEKELALRSQGLELHKRKVGAATALLGRSLQPQGAAGGREALSVKGASGGES